MQLQSALNQPLQTVGTWSSSGNALYSLCCPRLLRLLYKVLSAIFRGAKRLRIGSFYSLVWHSQLGKMGHDFDLLLPKLPVSSAQWAVSVYPQAGEGQPGRWSDSSSDIFTFYGIKGCIIWQQAAKVSTHCIMWQKEGLVVKNISHSLPQILLQSSSFHWKNGLANFALLRAAPQS